MAGREIELHPEVEEWFTSLDERSQDRAARAIDLLAEHGEQIRGPHSTALGAGLFELRFTLRDEARRITYRFAPDGRIVLLTTFRKQRDNERREVDRARAELRRCQTECDAQEE